MKDETRPPSDTLDKLGTALRHIVSVPKTEIDRRAKAWAKRRRHTLKTRTPHAE
jgi:hypothetical protein